jgi:glyoxylase-like metal-dependent hydrolase (beta-lactamase superfamily II)
MKEDITQNIVRICLPIPFPLKTVNVYALIGPNGWTLVDTAIGAPDTRTAFFSGLEQAGLQIKDLQAIVLTHHHPDHIGLSGELQEQSGAPVYMHALDKAAINVHDTASMPHRFGRVSQFLSQHGLPATELWFARVNPKEMHQLIRVPPQEVIHTVEDGEELELSGEIYTVLWTPGHADGQICLYRKRDQLFLSADHVLPRITPNIGLYSEKDRQNPLDDYLTSLTRVAQFPASLVLPGHGDPLTDLAGRVHEIQAHHEEREQQILALLAQEPQHATQLASQLFGGRLKSDEAWRMGVAEVVAHLEYMRLKQLLTRQANAEGVLIYTPLDSTGEHA